VDVEVIIETPRGSRNKYEMDSASGRIRLDRMLFTSTRYPADYGFIPGTPATGCEPGHAVSTSPFAPVPVMRVLARAPAALAGPVSWPLSSVLAVTSSSRVTTRPSAC